MYPSNFHKSARLVLIFTVALICAAWPAPAADSAAVVPLHLHQPKFFRAVRPLSPTAKPHKPAAVLSAKSKTADNSGPVVVNSASYLVGVSPGGLATIFNADLTGTPTGIVSANTDPLPYQLENISIFVNGVPAPMFSVAYDPSANQNQISFQVPYDTATGLNAAEVQVQVAGLTVADVFTASYTEDPGIFVYYASNNLDYPVAVRYPDYTLIGPNNPANPGDILILYTTGIGPLNVSLQDGYGAPSDPLATTIDPFLTVLNNQDCTVLFSGLAPGFVGLDQLNIVVPSDAAAGDLALQISTSYASSNTVYLPVQ